MKKYILVLALMLTGFNSVFAQDQKAIENNLLTHLKKLTYWSFYYSNNSIDKSLDPYDSLDRENIIFQTKLLDYTSKYPETISRDFKELIKAGLIISTSVDGLFRIYSWDTWKGGTMHYYDNIYQYKSGDKVFSVPISRDTVEGGDPRSWYSQIYIFLNNGKNITWELKIQSIRLKIYPSLLSFLQLRIIP